MTGPCTMRRGQAMLETVICMLFLATVFFALFQLSQMLLARTMLDHAAACAARARAVGFNDFMCLKTARAAMIPAAGRRIWPEEASPWSEVSRVPDYLSSPDEARASAVLDYERWHTTEVKVDPGTGQSVGAALRMEADDFTAAGLCEVESHYPLYMLYGGR